MGPTSKEKGRGAEEKGKGAGEKKSEEKVGRKARKGK